MQRWLMLFMTVFLAAACRNSLSEADAGPRRAVTFWGGTNEAGRTSMGEEVDGRIRMLWSEGDRIGLVNPRNNHVPAPLVSGAGTQIGRFRADLRLSGEGTDAVRIFYPWRADGTLTIAAEQEQPAPDRSDGIGANDCAWAETTIGEDAVARFTLSHLPLFLRFSIRSVAYASWRLTALRVATDHPTEGLAGTLAFDWTTHTASLAADTSRSVTLSFGSPFTLGSEARTAYLALFPAALAGSTLSVRYVLEDGEGHHAILTAQRAARDFRAGSTVPVEVTLDASMDRTVDLNASGQSANCYVVAPNAVARFDATLRGNNSGRVGNSGFDGSPLDARSIARAVLLWEAVPDADPERCRRVIDGEPWLDPDGHVLFAAGTEAGNAVIGIEDASGTILWSWHIWVTPDAEALNAGSAASPHALMPYNLGALTAGAAVTDNRGLLFQWGRKDPFLPTAVAYSTTPGVLNLSTGDGEGSWNYASYAPTATAAPGNIAYSVTLPMTYLAADGTDWYVTVRQGNSDQISGQLWGGGYLEGERVSGQTGKTIFDPCPVGWKVPEAGAWGMTTDATWHLGPENKGAYWGADADGYYPFQGTLSSIGGRAYYDIFPYSGELWYATTYRSPYAPRMFVTNSHNQISVRVIYENGVRSDGYAIRCIREEAESRTGR